jgi:hypothetical protein
MLGANLLGALGGAFDRNAVLSTEFAKPLLRAVVKLDVGKIFQRNLLPHAIWQIVASAHLFVGVRILRRDGGWADVESRVSLARMLGSTFAWEQGDTHTLAHRNMHTGRKPRA